MEDEGMKGMDRPYENEESESKVDHYHAHGKNCEDMGHHLEKGEHTLPHEDEGHDTQEHTEPAEDKGGEYAGMVRKIR
jgi:hypothetical protein